MPILKKEVPASTVTNADTNVSDDDSSVNNSVTETEKKVNSNSRRKSNRSKGQKKAANRKRTFATIVYPDSAPADWKDKLSDMHIPALACFHDQDVNPDGSIKKPHYHVLFLFEGPKDFDSQVKPLFDIIGGVGKEEVYTLRGYARYLCHLDNPEKHQYDTSNIIQFGGADYKSIIHLPSNDNKLLKEIFDFVKKNQIYSLAEIIDISAEQNEDWFNLITSKCCYIVDKYMKAIYWEALNTGYMRMEDMKRAEQKAEEDYIKLKEEETEVTDTEETETEVTEIETNETLDSDDTSSVVKDCVATCEVLDNADDL